jgi:hypothetical protein
MQRSSKQGDQQKHPSQYAEHWEELHSTPNLMSVLLKDLDTYIAENNLQVEGSLDKQE